MKKYLLPQTGNFYKANLHCHSTISDGELSPAELKEAYMAHGYSIIAYTDHNILLSHDELTDENFLALHGYEWDVTDRVTPPACPKCCHICLIALEPDNMKQICWHRNQDIYFYGNGRNYKHLVQFYEDEPDFERSYNVDCVNEVIKKAREHGFFVTYNHPTWSQEDYSDYINYHGMNAMEICNYTSKNGGFPEYNPRVYDDMLRSGKRIFCIAADDNHCHTDMNTPYGDCFGGFTVIKAENLEYRTITKALEAGHFYASQGPEIKELWYEDGELHITTSPAQRVDFYFGIRHAGSVKADGEKLVEQAHCKVPENAIYVRATVWDEHGKPADTNAYFVDELNK